jgi:mono/diheme cytochrome c family protein
MPDGELFWTISHGIRMTGMPAMGATHSEEELWRIAAFVRELPELSEEQRRRLRGEVAPAKEAEPAVGAHEHEGHEHEAKGEEF